MRLTIFLLTLLALLSFSAPALAASQAVPSAPVIQSGPDISYGIPEVTTQQAEAKAFRIYNEAYRLIYAVAPGLTMFLLIAAVLLSIFFKEAKRAIFGITLFLVLVMWGPQIFGWFVHVLRA